jgi:hypothetical protein
MEILLFDCCHIGVPTASASTVRERRRSCQADGSARRYGTKSSWHEATRVSLRSTRATPLKLGTLVAILGDVAAHQEINRDALLDRLLG